MQPWSPVRTAALVSTLLALGPAAANAEPPWLAPEAVSASAERVAPGSLAFAVAPSGDAVAAWSAVREGGWVVRATTRSARGPWQAPLDLSPVIAPAVPGSELGAPTPRAVIGPGGDAAVAWTSGGEGVLRLGSALMVAVRSGATGAWMPAQRVSAPGGAPPTVIASRLAIEPSGTVLAVWQQGAVGVLAATRPADTGDWSEPVDLTAADDPGFPPIGSLAGLASGRTGAAAVLRVGSGGALRLAIRPPGGSFSAPEIIQPGLLPGPRLAVGPGEEIIAVRAPLDDEGLPERVEAAVRPAGGPLGAYVTLGPATSLSFEPVAVDGAGNAVATWSAPGRTVSVAERPAGGAWSTPAPILAGSVPTAPPEIALNAAGAGVVVVPRDQADGGPDIAAAVRPAPGMPFGAPERVAPSSDDADVAAPAIDDLGVAAVAYAADGRARSVLRSRDAPGSVRLTGAQLLINQRIAQAAVRRANAIEARLSAGLTAADIRPGGLQASAFAPGVAVAGEETGGLTPPGPGRPLEVPEPERGDPAAVRLSAAQLLINQRIAQAAVRRANRLAELVAGELTGAQVADGAIGPEHLAPGLSIAGAVGGGAAPAPAVEPKPSAEGRQGGRVTLSAAQLRINQRISQAAVRRLNSLVAQLERGLPGSAFAHGTIRAADVVPGVRSG